MLLQAVLLNGRGRALTAFIALAIEVCWPQIKETLLILAGGKVWLTPNTCYYRWRLIKSR